MDKQIIWMTGLSGAGKTTLAKGLKAQFDEDGIPSFILDGDILRTGINSDLDFTREGRRENVRRVGEIARILADAGVIPIVALISPYQEDRDRVRQRLQDYLFTEVYVKCSLEVCEQRDPKGLYKKARAQQIAHFTGVSDVFEPPAHPHIVIDTSVKDHTVSLQELIAALTVNG